MRRHRFWLCVAPIAVFGLDIGLTLYGQPERYWTGEYSYALEGSPEVRRVMQIHPVLLYFLIAAWIGVIVTLVLALPGVMAEWFAAAVVLGHVIGTSSWIHRLFENSYQWNMGLAAVGALLWTVTLSNYRKSIPANVESQTSKVMLLIAVVLLLTIGYATLFPH